MKKENARCDDMSYTIFVKEGREGNEDSAEFWVGEDIEEHAKLCECQTITPIFLKYLPKNGRILEAGCGLGRWLIYFSKRGYDIERIELNEDVLGKIKNFNSNLKTIRGNILEMPYEDNSFNAVISLGVIEHSKEGPQKALKEMYRILKPGGILLVTVPYLNLMRRLLHIPYQALIVRIRRIQGFNMKFDSYVYTKKEMQAFLKNTGFEIIDVAPDDFIYPKSLGLYTDWTRYLGSRTTKWELNKFGKVIQRILSLFSPWIWSNGILFVARIRK